MQLAYIILTLLVVITILVIIKQIYSIRDRIPFINRYFMEEEIIEIPKPSPRYRVMMAIRRRDVGRSRFMMLPNEEQHLLISRSQNEIQNLQKAWRPYIKFLGGYDGSDMGLVSNTENEWMHFAFYNTESYDAYRECQRILDSEAYLNLRNEFDIRILFGEQMKTPDADSRLHQLF